LVDSNKQRMKFAMFTASWYAGSLHQGTWIMLLHYLCSCSGHGHAQCSRGKIKCPFPLNVDTLHIYICICTVYLNAPCSCSTPHLYIHIYIDAASCRASVHLVPRSLVVWAPTPTPNWMPIYTFLSVLCLEKITRGCFEMEMRAWTCTGKLLCWYEAADSSVL
jgi:hypothetical protein